MSAMTNRKAEDNRGRRVGNRRITASNNKFSHSKLLNLPDDALFVILSYCDLQSLGTLSRVCKKLNSLVQSDCVWIWMYRKITKIERQSHESVSPTQGQARTSEVQEQISVKEKCRIAHNWKNGISRDSRLVYHKVRHLPCLQMRDDTFWVSYKNLIHCYTQKKISGRLLEQPGRTLIGHNDDVCHFVVRGSRIVSGGRDRNIVAWNTETGKCDHFIHNAHTSDIDCVDFHDNVIVSGSRDTTVKIWKMNEHDGCDMHQKLDINDRVWSLIISPDVRSFLTGSAGRHQVAPLQEWDLERGELKRIFGRNFRHGAGVRDLQYHTEHTVLSCGYDTYIRMWDMRTSCTDSVIQWADPFDSTIYCVKGDGNHAVVAGTARHGMVRLWDTRMISPVQCYYIGKASSPVYSLTFDPAHLYVALDKGVNMLDFSIHRNISTPASGQWQII